MATASTSTSSPERTDNDDIFNSDKFVLCPVCLDYYDVPKLLPCAHVVCCKCLLKWLQANPMPKRCPICRGDITEEQFCHLPATFTPEEICQALPTDLSMESLVDASKQLKGPHECGKCGQEATSFCLSCYLKLCKECRQKHSKSIKKKVARARASREAAVAKVGTEDLGMDADHPNVPYIAPKLHDIELLSNLNQMRIGNQRVTKCTTHTDNNNFKIYFCETHNTSLCVLCVREDHSQCQIVTSDAKVAEQQQVLREQRRRLLHQEELLREEEERMTQKEQESEKRSEELQEELDGMLDKMLDRLRVAKMKLKADVEGLDGMPAEEKLKQQSALLSAFREDLQGIVSMNEAAEAVHDFVESNQETVRDAQETCDRLRGRRSQCPQSCVHNPRHNAYHNHRQPLLTELNSVTDDLNTAVQAAVTALEENLTLPSADHYDDNDADTPSSPPPPSC